MKMGLLKNKKRLLILLSIVCTFYMVNAQDSKPKVKPKTASKPPAVKTQPKTNNTQTENKYGTVTDIDGNVYKTVKIGNQIWMAENLKTRHYNDGTPILNVTDNKVWESLRIGAYCYYDNDYSSNNAIYGKLYNWYAVETGKLAPDGWHVPSDAEWTQLINYLGGENVAGGKMKSTAYWKNPNASNSSGFTGLPAGYRRYNGMFNNVGSYVYFWSSTEFSTTNAWTCNLGYADSNAGRGLNNKPYGFSVRCVRD